MTAKEWNKEMRKFYAGTLTAQKVLKEQTREHRIVKRNYKQTNKSLEQYNRVASSYDVEYYEAEYKSWELEASFRTYQEAKQYIA